ncbi:MAG: 23S rRNA (adenine(2503)-C(2))-methyltransferase RlmN, partial [Bacteroidales bacterium]|nr:23S rRNA (adenine(2503)-C(2))-methyltransferase RlmN [Bacteroidales bacterium]
MINEKINIRNLTDQEIINFLIEQGEKQFRKEQIIKWLWQKGVSSLNEMNNLTESLREKLNTSFYIDKIKIAEKHISKDTTTKVLFVTIDNLYFEGVLIPDRDRVTACISTQVGCPLKCSFCATGKIKYHRNLSSGEIFDQVFELNKLSEAQYKRKLSNIVVMGMGEPLLNYNNTIRAIDILTSASGLGISPQRITLSTAGIPEGITQLANDNININLSVSLHSAIDSKRDDLMPINKKHNLKSLSDAIKYYYQKTRKRITYEYLLLGEINDSYEDAVALTEFTKISACKINLIEYNPTENDIYKPSKKERVKQFEDYIKTKNLVVTIRKSKGQDIN